MKFHKLTYAQIGFALLGLVIAACLSILWAMQASRLINSEPSFSAVESIPASQYLQGNVPATAATSDVMPVQAFAPSESTVMQAMPQAIVRTSWQMGNAKTSMPKLPLSERVSAYTLVELEQSPAHFPAVGEQVEMPMLNGQKVIVNVQSTMTNPNGDTTWSGHLDGYGDDYPVVMTYGEHSIFATITTPEGSYTMESLDGVGWLYKNPAEIELSDPGAKDFLEIDAPH